MVGLIRLSSALVFITLVAWSQSGARSIVEARTIESSNDDARTLPSSNDDAIPKIKDYVETYMKDLSKFVQQAWNSRMSSNSKLGRDDFMKTVYEEITKFKDMIKFKKTSDGKNMDSNQLAHMFKLGETGAAGPSELADLSKSGLSGGFSPSSEVDEHIKQVRKKVMYDRALSRTYNLTSSLIGDELRDLALLISGLHPSCPQSKETLMAETQKKILLKVIEWVIGMAVDLLSMIFGQKIEIPTTGDAMKSTKKASFKGIELLPDYGNWID